MIEKTKKNKYDFKERLPFLLVAILLIFYLAYLQAYTFIIICTTNLAESEPAILCNAIIFNIIYEII
jgi:hypothetical protein